MSTKTNNKLAHHTFAPWQVDGDRRIVAGDAYWFDPVIWNQVEDELRSLDAITDRPRVLIGVDVFEDYCVRVNGGPLTDVVNPITMQDIRLRLFRTIDACPNLDWMVFTRTPENTAGMLPEFSTSGERPAVDRMYAGLKVTRPNLWLGTDIDDQATADERIPHLLRVPAKVRMVRYSGVGKVDLMAYLGDADEQYQHFEKPVGVYWLIISGEVGPDARPCNLEHVRDAISQTKAAGVPVWVERLGSRPVRADGRRVGPYDREEGYFPRCSRCGHFDFGPCSDGTLLCNGCDSPWGGLRDPHGADPAEWPEDLRTREVPSC